MANASAPIGQPKPILVEILAYAPTQFFHCQHCELVWQQVGGLASGDPSARSLGSQFHQEQLDASIPDDLQKQYAELSDWVRQTVEQYGGRVIFKIIDAASFEGLLKSVRYGTRRYPAFVIAGKAKLSGADFDRVRQLIDARLASASV